MNIRSIFGEAGFYRPHEPNVQLNCKRRVRDNAGWVGDEFAEAAGETAGRLPRFRQGVMTRMPRGRASADLEGGETSDPVMIDFLKPQPIIPRINLVSNAVAGGVEVHARSEKALFRVFAGGLDGTATPDKVRLRLRQHGLNPISVSFIPASGVYMTVARMPDDLSPGEAEISLQFGDPVSLPVKTQIN